MMKKYWRKMMALTCAAAMLFTMAGCGNAEGTTGGAETAQSSMTADGSGEITIQFAEHVADIQAQEPHLQKIITAFEESHPGIKIDITGKEVSEHNTQMTLLAGENKLPDVFWLEQATAKEFAQNGYLYDLTDALDQYGINDSLLPGLVHSCTVDGKDVGMPSEVMMVGFFYNKDLFQQAGIEEVPVTYEEFLDVVDKLNAAGITPLTVGAQDNYSIWAFETMLARYGFFEKLDGLKDGSISWNNEDFMQFWQFYYGEEGTKIIAEDTAALPCSTYNGQIDESQHPVLSTMITALNDDWKAVTEPFNSLSSNVAYGYFDATFGVMTGVYTPEQAADYVENLQSAER